VLETPLAIITQLHRQHIRTWRTRNKKKCHQKFDSD